MVRMTLITDLDGRIIGGAFPAEKRDSEMLVQLRPLPGQRLHEVQVREDLVRVKTPDELLRNLSVFRVESGQSRLVMRAEAAPVIAREPRKAAARAVKRSSGRRPAKS
jgi:hypothetical protein